MEYRDVLLKAFENSKLVSKKDVRCYNTSFGPNRKTEKSKVTSDSVKKFLARKEKQEHQKKNEACRRMNDLITLRNQDKKAQRRVQAMIKTTKSANKSVMADAVNNVDTADTLDGLKQCDEDDYGYVSQESTDLFNQFLIKYQINETKLNQPKKAVVKDLCSAVNKDKAVIKENIKIPTLDALVARESNAESNDPVSVCDTQDNKEKKEKDANKVKNCLPRSPVDVKLKRGPIALKPKLKHSGPAPMNYSDLLKLAQEKQFQPILIDAPPVECKQQRLMTEEEKIEFVQEKEAKLRRVNRNAEGKGLKPSNPMKANLRYNMNFHDFDTKLAKPNCSTQKTNRIIPINKVAMNSSHGSFRFIHKSNKGTFLKTVGSKAT